MIYIHIYFRKNIFHVEKLFLFFHIYSEYLFFFKQILFYEEKLYFIFIFFHINKFAK